MTHAASREEILGRVARRWMQMLLASAFESWRNLAAWKVNMQKVSGEWKVWETIGKGKIFRMGG